MKDSQKSALLLLIFRINGWPARWFLVRFFTYRMLPHPQYAIRRAGFKILLAVMIGAFIKPDDQGELSWKALSKRGHCTQAMSRFLGAAAANAEVSSTVAGNWRWMTNRFCVKDAIG